MSCPKINPCLIHLRETDSTNNFLKNILEKEELPSGSIILTDYQTAGKGQQGNSWESEAGKNLLFSILLRPENITTDHFFIISEIASLSIKYTLDKYIDDITVKWPNDIYYKDKKIAGILIENFLSRNIIFQSIIGTGINVNQREFLSNAPNPVSLRIITGHDFDLMELIEVFQTNFSLLCKKSSTAQFDSLHKEYLYSLYRKEGFYKYKDENGSFMAKIKDVEQNGYLILEKENGDISKYLFKEVEYIQNRR
jgi:BirA family biotin operon repressor/biotin-[acetyl-CoA-carboxylase] ligase